MACVNLSASFRRLLSCFIGHVAQPHSLFAPQNPLGNTSESLTNKKFKSLQFVTRVIKIVTIVINPKCLLA